MQNAMLHVKLALDKISIMIIISQKEVRMPAKKKTKRKATKKKKTTKRKKKVTKKKKTAKKKKTKKRKKR